MGERKMEMERKRERERESMGHRERGRDGEERFSSSFFRIFPFPLLSFPDASSLFPAISPLCLLPSSCTRATCVRAAGSVPCIALFSSRVRCTHALLIFSSPLVFPSLAMRQIMDEFHEYMITVHIVLLGTRAGLKRSQARGDVGWLAEERRKTRHELACCAQSPKHEYEHERGHGHEHVGKVRGREGEVTRTLEEESKKQGHGAGGTFERSSCEGRQ